MRCAASGLSEVFSEWTEWRCAVIGLSEACGE